MGFVQLPESVVLFLFSDLVSFSHYFFEYFFSSTLSPFILDSGDTNIRSFAVAPQVHEALFFLLLFFVFQSIFLSVGHTGYFLSSSSLILYYIPSILG